MLQRASCKILLHSCDQSDRVDLLMLEPIVSIVVVVEAAWQRSPGTRTAPRSLAGFLAR